MGNVVRGCSDRSVNWNLDSGCSPRRFCDDDGDWRNETVSGARNGFDEARVVGIVIKGSAKLLENHIKAAVEINEGTVGPEIAPQLITRDDLTGMLQKHEQNTEGLVLNLYAQTIAGERFVGDIGLEQTESEAARGGS